MLTVPKVWKGISIDATTPEHKAIMGKPRGYCSCGCCSFSYMNGCR